MHPPHFTLQTLREAAMGLAAGHWLHQGVADGAADRESGEGWVLSVQGDLTLDSLDLQAPLAPTSALRAHWPVHIQPPDALLLLIVQGTLRVAGAVVDDGSTRSTHVCVRGDLHCADALLSQATVHVEGALHVSGLLWGNVAPPEGTAAHHLQVQGPLQAAVAVFTPGYRLHIGGPEQTGLCSDAARGDPSLAATGHEALALALDPRLLRALAPATEHAEDLIDLQRLAAALRAGHPVLREPLMLWPLDAALCPGEAITLAHLQQLIRAALPDKSRHKAQGWFGQTDFLLTRRHQDDDGDTYHDGLFLTEWKTWDFWFSDVPPPESQSLLAAAAARLRQWATAPWQGLGRPATGFTRLYRAYGDDGRHGPWQPMDGPDADVPGAALQACDRAWRSLIDYWRKAEGQRRAGRPLRQQVQALLTPARVEALTLLPVFTAEFNDWWDGDRNGWWEDDLWVGARQPCVHHGKCWGRAFKLSWKNGAPAPSDADDDTHACYQIDIDRTSSSAAPAAAHLSYAQRQGDERVPLPWDAVDHMARLVRLFTAIEQRLQHANDTLLARETDTRRIEAAVRLLGEPPFAEHAADGSIFPAELLSTSDAWQADGRAYVAQMRERLINAEACEQAPAGGAPGAAIDTPGPEDARRYRAATVLQLARVVSRHADADLAARLHRRFAFAPDAFAQRAAQSGQAIGPVFLRDDGSIVARIGLPGAAGTHWVQTRTNGLEVLPLPGLPHTDLQALDHDGQPQRGLAHTSLSATEGTATTTANDRGWRIGAAASARGLVVLGDDQGMLHGLDEDGHVLWHHQVGGSISAIDVAPDGRTIVAGSQGGYLVVLRKGAGPDPFVVGTSRFTEARRFIFWTDEPAPIRW